jgi:hypothetical protein
MKARFLILPLFCVYLALAACSPGDRGWSRSAADFNPLAGAPAGARPDLGPITVAPARIQASLPEGLDKAAAEKLITDIFVKDLLACGRFSAVEHAGADSAAAVYPALTRLTVRQDNGAYKLLAAEVEIKFSKGGRLLLQRTYAKTWSGAAAPDHEKAWSEALPPALLEMREDIIAAAAL